MPHDDDDPVVATYNVYIAPSPSQSQPTDSDQPTQQNSKLYVLQYPSHRPWSKPYDTSRAQKPTAFRIKPNAGVFELDIPIPATDNYNSNLGTEFGRAMNDSAQLHPTTGHGLSGGFAQNSTSTAKLNLTDVPDHHSQAALQTQTLGGKIAQSTERDPVYMLATLKSGLKQIELQHLDGLVQMRPQLHHIDAIDEMKKRAELAGKVKAPVDTGPVKLETRAIEMKVKDSNKDDPKDRNLNANAKLLRDIQNDTWQRYTWFEKGESENVAMHGRGEVASTPLQAALDDDEWLNQMSSPGIELRTRLKGRDRERARRKRQERLKSQRASGQNVVSGIDISDSESGSDDEENQGDQADVGLSNVPIPSSPEVIIKKEGEPASTAAPPTPKRRGRPSKNA